MVLSKKRMFLFSSILLLILVGIYFADAFGSITRGTSFVTTTSTVSSVSGINYTELSNWTRGGKTENINFTIVLAQPAGVNGTKQLNITLPTTFSFPAAMLSNNVGFSKNATDVNITIVNTSSVFSVQVVSSNLGGNFSGTVNVFFNVTAGEGVEAVRNWTITTVANSSTQETDSGFGVLTGIDGLAPRMSNHNVTDNTNTITSFSSTQYLKYDTTNSQVGVNITLTTTDYNMDRVLLVYNNTGGSLNLVALRGLLYNSSFLNSNHAGGTTNWTVLEKAGPTGGKANVSTLDTRSELSSSAPSYVYTFNISNSTWGLGASDGLAFKYVFVVYDLFNNSEIINNSNAEFVLARDVNVPAVTLTAPTDVDIDVFGSIKYTCSGSDTSSISSCELKITKPSGATVTKNSCSEQTFTGTDTNEAGSYTVNCKVIDGVSRTSSTSSVFRTAVSTSGGDGSSGGSGSGGGSGSPGSSAENPVTAEQGATVDAGTLSTTETYTSVAKEGTVTFAVSGNSHRVKVLDVTETSATIEIASTPKQLTLNVGETKEVDVNDDTKNDLSVTLKSITNGKADLVFKTIETITPPGGETGGTTGEQPEKGVETGEETGTSLTWLWILILVVLVLVIWYFSKKKQ